MVSVESDKPDIVIDPMQGGHQTVQAHTVQAQSVQMGSNNTTNNTTINIISFNPDDPAQLQLLTDHMDATQLKRIRRSMRTKKQPDVFMDYTKALLDNPGNQCVRKTNLRGVHSRVHVGKGHWETRHDQEVYPKFVSDVAVCLTQFLETKHEDIQRDPHAFEQLLAFADYMADQGYCADDNKQSEIRANYKQLVQRTKGVIFDRSKES
jgi:hypothetical protein